MYQWIEDMKAQRLKKRLPGLSISEIQFVYSITVG